LQSTASGNIHPEVVMQFSMERNSARHLSEVRDGMPEHVVHFDLTPPGLVLWQVWEAQDDNVRSTVAP
jgi:hypothetical protein